MRFGLSLLMLLALSQMAEAGDCIITGPPVKLDTAQVSWSFEIASGRICLRGLRSSAMILDSVSVSTPARHGEAAAKGYGFSYQAPDNFKGEDEFAITVSGTNRGVRGLTTIQVHVSVR